MEDLQTFCALHEITLFVGKATEQNGELLAVTNDLYVIRRSYKDSDLETEAKEFLKQINDKLKS